jgi:hypothetical protein
MVKFIEDAISPIPFMRIHIIRPVEEIHRSRLTGDAYGPFFRCEVVELPRDLAEFFLKQGWAEDVPAGGLRPIDVQTLWNIWLEVTTPVMGDFALATYRDFLNRIDPRASLETNMEIVRREAIKYIEPLRLRPFVPLARRPLILPGIEEAIRLAGGPPEVQAGLAPPGVGLWELPRRFPEEFRRFLREEVGMEPDEFRFMSLREQLTILRAFRGWLSRQGILP